MFLGLGHVPMWPLSLQPATPRWGTGLHAPPAPASPPSPAQWPQALGCSQQAPPYSTPAGKPPSGNGRVTGQHPPSTMCRGAPLPGAGERKGGHLGPWGLRACGPAVGSPALAHGCPCSASFPGGPPLPSELTPHPGASWCLRCGLGSVLGSAEAWGAGGRGTPT